MMDPRIVTALSQEHVSADVQALLASMKEHLRLSRAKMNEYYNQWELNDRTYRGLKVPDEQDRQAQKRKEPKKVIMPVSKAQINTFVSFFLEVVNQSDYFYQLGGTGAEDEQAAKVG